MRRIGFQSACECPCETTLRYIGGAWKVLIVWHLAHYGKHRHAELKRRLRGITAKILTQQLREMEEDGLVQREVFAEVPPRVEYQLSPRGETLRPLIDAMYAWGKLQTECDQNGAKSVALSLKTANPHAAKPSRNTRSKQSVPLKRTLAL